MQVDIPENFLLIIAARGEMGSGELPRSMQVWAQSICRKNPSLSSKLEALQNEWKQELKARLQAIQWIDVSKQPVEEE